MLRSRATAAIRWICAFSSTPPVGFCGELMMMSFLRGVADVHGRVEVRLSDLEMHDLLALALQRLGAREHFERRFRAESRHPCGDVHNPSSIGAVILHSRAWTSSASPAGTSRWDLT